MRVVHFLRSHYPASYVLPLLLSLAAGCSVAAPKSAANIETKTVTDKSNSTNSNQAATIHIEPNGPADTIRVFYKHLREKKFRDAIFLTNLKPAVAGLTDAELKDFSVDFEAIAGLVPAEVKINGEVISGDKASVTADLPSNDSDKNEIQTLNLRKENDIWVIILVDEAAEAEMKKEGKNYFNSLRIKTHEEEAGKMLERISKAQIVHSLQNGGLYTDKETLISEGFLPEDASTSESTGYNYAVNLSQDKKKYSATATPAVYNKSGKLSFLLLLDAKSISHVTSKDNGGKPMSK